MRGSREDSERRYKAAEDHSTSLARLPKALSVAKRPGVRQPSGAVAWRGSCQRACPFPMAQGHRRFGIIPCLPVGNIDLVPNRRRCIGASVQNAGAIYGAPTVARAFGECASPQLLWPKTRLANRAAYEIRRPTRLSSPSCPAKSDEDGRWIPWRRVESLAVNGTFSES